jgi:hypothetical protein
MNSIDNNFTITLTEDKELSKLRELEFEYHGIKFKAPIYLVKVDELVNSIINKVAEITAVAQKFGHNPLDTTVVIVLFEDQNKYSIDYLNDIINTLLKYKEMSMYPIVYPYSIELVCEYFDEENDLRRVYDYIKPIQRIDEAFLNYRLVVQIVKRIMKNEKLSAYYIYTDKEDIFLKEPFIEGYKTLSFTNAEDLKVKELNVKINFTTFYTIPVDYISYLIYQSMQKPKNVIISKDNERDKYIVSWEY